MSVVDPIFVGDVGTTLRCTVKDRINGTLTVVPVDAATAAGEKQILLKSPAAGSGWVAYEAIFTTDGLDGRIERDTEAGDIDVGGTWWMRAKVVLGAKTFYSRKTKIDVYDPLA